MKIFIFIIAALASLLPVKNLLVRHAHAQTPVPEGTPRAVTGGTRTLVPGVARTPLSGIALPPAADALIDPGEYQGLPGLIKFIGLALETPSTAAEKALDVNPAGGRALSGKVRAVLLPATGCDSSWVVAIGSLAASSLEAMGFGVSTGPKVTRILKEAGIPLRGPFEIEEFEEIEESMDCDLVISIEVAEPFETKEANLRSFFKSPGSLGKARRIKAQISAQVFIPSRGLIYRLKAVKIDARTFVSGEEGLKRAIAGGVEKLLGTRFQ